MSRSVSDHPSSRTTTAFTPDRGSRRVRPITATFLDARDIDDHVLDFLRRDLLATGLDDVVHAPDEIEISLFVELAVVSGVQHHLARQRPGAHFPGSLFRLFPVPAHHRRAAYYELPDFAGAQLLVFVVHDP
jgi:hypothetical protein